MKNAQEPKAIETVSSSYSRRIVKKTFKNPIHLIETDT